MGIESGISNKEIQSQEMQKVDNEQLAQNQDAHQRNSEELENNFAIDNEDDRKPIERKDDVSESTEDESSQLDKNDSIESETQKEQKIETENTISEQEYLNNLNTFEKDTVGVEEVLDDNEEVTESLDDDSFIKMDIEESEDTETLAEHGEQNNLDEYNLQDDLKIGLYSDDETVENDKSFGVEFDNDVATDNEEKYNEAVEKDEITEKSANMGDVAELEKDSEDNINSNEIVEAKENTEDNTGANDNAETEENHEDNGDSRNTEISTYTQENLNNLENMDNFRSSAVEHIFNGEVNRRGQAVGYHYEGIEESPGNVIEGTKNEPDENGVYIASVEVDGIAKSGNGGMSTFYPDNMSPQEVIDAINEAYNNRVNTRGNTYVGESENGLGITMYLDANDKIISSFPIYEGDE